MEGWWGHPWATMECPELHPLAQEERFNLSITSLSPGDTAGRLLAHPTPLRLLSSPHLTALAHNPGSLPDTVCVLSLTH